MKRIKSIGHKVEQKESNNNLWDIMFLQKRGLELAKEMYDKGYFQCEFKKSCDSENKRKNYLRGPDSNRRHLLKNCQAVLPRII